jgi:CheY-like chemotaxis protein
MHFAHSGEEALNKLEDGLQPDPMVVLSDINMPGMDGLGLLQRVKKRFPDLPVFMVTAYADDDRRRQASKHGATDFLAKPIDFQALTQQLARLPS